MAARIIRDLQEPFNNFPHEEISPANGCLVIIPHNIYVKLQGGNPSQIALSLRPAVFSGQVLYFSSEKGEYLPTRTLIMVDAIQRTITFGLGNGQELVAGWHEICDESNLPTQDSPTPQEITPLQLAQVALNYGFIPIPLKGKIPIMPRWQRTTASTALRKVETAVTNSQADNIGILTGKPSNVVVVDIDISKGGLDFWNELIIENGETYTFTVETPSGGRHYYFNYDDRTATLRNATAAIQQRGIDLKTTGGQVVFAFSKGSNDRIYEPIDGFNVETDELFIADMPEWLFNLLQQNQQQLNVRYPKKYQQ